MDQGSINTILEFMSDAVPADYPFNDMFGGMWRIAIPLETKNVLATLSENDQRILKYFALFANSIDRWTSDFKNGIATKIVKETNRLTGETIDREVQIRLGKLFPKVIAQYEKLNKKLGIELEAYKQNKEIRAYDAANSSILTNRGRIEWCKKAQELWNKKSELIQTGKLMIIISQHPIDVLRMSDFHSLESCHTQGANFFMCAIVEAQAHGPIAYVVRLSDYEKYKDRLQEQEVFADNLSMAPDPVQDDDDTIEMRNVEGMVPICRIRFREIEIKGIGSFPIPERTQYGTDIAGFRDILMSWAKTSPIYRDATYRKNITKDDLQLHGGSYKDSEPYELVSDYIVREVRGVYSVNTVEEVVRDYVRENEEVVEQDYDLEMFQDHWELSMTLQPLDIPCDTSIYTSRDAKDDATQALIKYAKNANRHVHDYDPLLVDEVKLSTSAISDYGNIICYFQKVIYKSTDDGEDLHNYFRYIQMQLQHIRNAARKELCQELAS